MGFTGSLKMDDTDKDINKNDSNECKLNLIFTDIAWEVGDTNTCPICRESPVQMLFDSDISHKFTVGECMLCKRLIAYKTKVMSHKRSKNINNSYDMTNKNIEVLKFLSVFKGCKKKCNMKNRTKNHNKNNSNKNQMRLF